MGPLDTKAQSPPRSPTLPACLQIWHLRPESTFYPKAQFQKALRHVPDGAQLAMLFGEIDCREGLLLAVQKCKVGWGAGRGDCSLR